jgi:hypothetical protein
VVPHEVAGPEASEFLLRLQLRVVRELGQFEPLERELIVSLVVQPDFVQVGDQIPVADQIDRVPQRLIRAGHFATGKRPVQRIAGAFAFQGSDVLRPVVGERKSTQAASANLPSTSTVASRLRVYRSAPAAGPV